ncbi:MAG: hypothetical protein R6U15_03775 [Candidatus Izemoplasmatales bacterium]
MKRLYLILFTITFIPGIKAQDAEVKNVNIDIKNNKVFVNYDLISNDLDKENSVELFFIDDRFTINVPGKVNGDIGKGIEPGVNKTIEWDVFKDDVSIAQKIQPKIIVNGIKKGGPKNAYLSFLMPGLGDYFVKDHKDMIIKPYYRTVFTLGTIGLGINALMQREDVPVYSIKTGTEYYDSDGDGLLDDIRPYKKEILIGNETKNWLFQHDAELLLATGITLWVADIIWVYAKGLENEKFKMFSNYSFDVKSHNGFTGFSLSYKF